MSTRYPESPEFESGPSVLGTSTGGAPEPFDPSEPSVLAALQSSVPSSQTCQSVPGGDDEMRAWISSRVNGPIGSSPGKASQ